MVYKNSMPKWEAIEIHGNPFEILGKVRHIKGINCKEDYYDFLLLEYLHNMRKWRGLLSFEIVFFNNPLKLLTATIMKLKSVHDHIPNKHLLNN